MDGQLSYSQRKTAARGLAIALALLAAIALGTLSPAQALASSENASLSVGQLGVLSESPIELSGKTLWAGNTSGTDLESYISDLDAGIIEDVKIVKVTSSDAAVLKVVGSGSYIYDYSVFPKKAGKATLSMTYKLGGKTSTVKQAYTVRDFEYCIDSMSINGNSIPVPSASNPSTKGYYYQLTGTKATFKITAADGCTVGNITARGIKFKKEKTEAAKTKTKVFTIPAGKTATLRVPVKTAEGKALIYSLTVLRCAPIELSTYSNDDDPGVLYVGHPKTTRVEFEPFGGISKISGFKTVSVKSSNPKVIKVTKKADPRKITLQAKKAGKATITVKYSWKGRTYTTRAKYTALTYPLKSIVLNGKKLNLVKNPFWYDIKKYAKKSATIKVNAAKGWKLKSITYNNKKVKNGSSFKPVKNLNSDADITLAKGSHTFEYHVGYWW